MSKIPNVTAVVGGQWGDEGKGKIVDYLATDAQVVIRAQGGDMQDIQSAMKKESLLSI